MPFSCMVTNCLPNEAVGGRNGQCLGLYGFSEDGKIESDNITDWSLAEFRGHYGDKSISKEQIFSYAYAMLHHPAFRTHFPPIFVTAYPESRWPRTSMSAAASARS